MHYNGCTENKIGHSESSLTFDKYRSRFEIKLHEKVLLRDARGLPPAVYQVHQVLKYSSTLYGSGGGTTIQSWQEGTPSSPGLAPSARLGYPIGWMGLPPIDWMGVPPSARWGTLQSVNWRGYPHCSDGVPLTPSARWGTPCQSEGGTPCQLDGSTFPRPRDGGGGAPPPGCEMTN